jgi:Fic family protein
VKKIDPNSERFAEFIYNSNLIEGIPELNFRDILQNTKNLATQKSSRTHIGALATILELARKQQNFDSKKLLEIHAKITSEQLVLGHPIAPRHIGKFRDCGVRIGFGIIPPPRKNDLRTFFRDFNCATKSIHSKNLFAILSEQHLIFERIHPFADGNGRAGRLLLLFQFLSAQFAGKISARVKIPVLENQKKENYYLAFRLFEGEKKELGVAQLAKFLENSTKN